MSMSYWQGDGELERGKQILFEGQPNEPDRPGERGLFRAFGDAFRKLGASGM